LTNRGYVDAFIVLILVAEFLLTSLIIKNIGYTEIDWIAYMQEVAGAIGGEYDYSKLRGDTGPLVYPAGFVYVYSALWRMTQKGVDILTAQHIFKWLYLANLALVLCIFRRCPKVPPVAFGLLCLSKRIHSIFVLRLFNDCFAVTLLHGAVLLFVHRRWGWGCLVYSCAVSVKMNIILCAPGLFLLLIQAHDGLFGVIRCLTICASLQLLVALPFLVEYPISYLKGSFDLSRVFMYQWTVNWKFLPEEVFVGKPFAIFLVAATLLTWSFFFLKKWPRLGSQQLSPEHITLTLFVSNFVGIVFARTLHYQFYSWYFHQLPFLLWHTRMPVLLKLMVLVSVEVAYNVYPATPGSSLLLQLAHGSLLMYLATTHHSTAITDSPRKAEIKKA
jgi:alpha-1,3-mannosyltransferase